MKKKLSKYALLTVVGLGVMGGAGAASAYTGMFGNQSPQDVASRQSQMFQSEADLLGISVDAVKSAWANGTSLKDLAAQNGISSDQLAQKIKDQRTAEIKARLQDLVSQGVITQAQADTRLSVMDKWASNKKIKGKRMGFHMGW